MILASESAILGLHPIKFVYVSILLSTAVALALMNYWIKTRAATSRVQAVVPVHNGSILWALVAALGLLVPANRQLMVVLTYIRTAMTHIVPVLLVRFATIYSGRSTSLRKPFNFVFLAGMGTGLIVLVTDPWLGLHFDPLSYHTEPFPYYETGFSPLWLVSLSVAYIGIGVGMYYFVELWFTSQHRSSRPLIIYVVGILLSLVPSILTVTGTVPLPGYNHTVFALSIASIAFFASTWLGMVRIAPVSRDRLLGTAGDGLIVLDDSGQITDHNGVATQFFTAPAQPMIGQSLTTVAPGLADILPNECAFDNETGASETSTSTNKPVLKDGNQLDSCRVEFTYRDGCQYSMVISPITDRNTIQGYALLIRDVTERYKNQQALKRQNEQLDEFAQSISHHLLNPLQVARGRTELARAHLQEHDAGSTDAVDLDQFEDLEQALDRIETIVMDLQTLARQGKSVDATTAVAFGDAVTEAGEIVTLDQASLSVQQDGTIQAERSRLLSILENLIRNSIDHAGPAVTMTVYLTDDGFVFEDDGPGIDADHDRLFEYGYTTSDDGSGLGLSIINTMVESMAGTFTSIPIPTTTVPNSSLPVQLLTFPL